MASLFDSEREYFSMTRTLYCVESLNLRKRGVNRCVSACLLLVAFEEGSSVGE